MSSITPDTTAIFKYSSATPDDAALKAVLASAAGNELLVGPEHIFAQAKSTPVYVNTTGADVVLSRKYLEHGIGRVIDITSIPDLKANWVFRLEFISYREDAF